MGADPALEVPLHISHIVSLLKDGLPLDEGSVRARFDIDEFGRKSNSALDESIASQWRRKCRHNARLFNGSKFRYAGMDWPCPGTPRLLLGLTSYRDHMGTNGSGRSSAELLQQAGLTVHGDRQAFLADPLGVGALVLTSDNRLVLVRRALWTGEYPGCVDRPGGHAEPDEVSCCWDGGGGADAGASTTDTDADAAVLSEVFESIRREVRDELGIPLQHVSRPYMVGALRDQSMGGRPTLEFVLRCSLPSSEVQRLYGEGKHAEADESLKLELFSRDELFGETALFNIPDLSDVSHEIAAPPSSASPLVTICASKKNSNVDENPNIAEADTNGSKLKADCDEPVSTLSNGPISQVIIHTDEYKELIAKNGDLQTQAEPPSVTSNTASSGRPQKKKRRNRKDKRSGQSVKVSVATKVQQSVINAVDAKAETKSGDQGRCGDSDQHYSCQGKEKSSQTGVTLLVASAEHERTSKSNPELSATSMPPLQSIATSSSVAKANSDVSIVTSNARCSDMPALTLTSQNGTCTVAAASTEVAGDEVVVVQPNGVVLVHSEGQVTATTMPACCSAAPAPAAGSQIETRADVSHADPEAQPPPQQDAPDPEPDKTAEQLERERKTLLWDHMTPSCRAALVLLKHMQLKGFVFQF